MTANMTDNSTVIAPSLHRQIANDNSLGFIPMRIKTFVRHLGETKKKLSVSVLRAQE